LESEPEYPLSGVSSIANCGTLHFSQNTHWQPVREKGNSREKIRTGQQLFLQSEGGRFNFQLRAFHVISIKKN
jgi:hypothetical protein